MAYTCKRCDIEFESFSALDVHKRADMSMQFCPAAPAYTGEASLPPSSTLDDSWTRRRRLRQGASAPPSETTSLALAALERQPRSAAIARAGTLSLHNYSHDWTPGRPRDAVDTERVRLMRQREDLAAQLEELRKFKAEGFHDRRGPPEKSRRSVLERGYSERVPREPDMRYYERSRESFNSGFPSYTNRYPRDAGYGAYDRGRYEEGSAHMRDSDEEGHHTAPPPMPARFGFPSPTLPMPVHIPVQSKPPPIVSPMPAVTSAPDYVMVHASAASVLPDGTLLIPSTAVNKQPKANTPYAAARETSPKLQPLALMDNKDAGGSGFNDDAAIAALLQLPKEVLETPAVQRHLTHLLEIRDNRLELEKLGQERELTKARSQLQREKDDLEQELLHEKWLSQQRRLVRETRIRKTLMDELGPELGAQYAAAASGIDVADVTGLDLSKPDRQGDGDAVKAAVTKALDKEPSALARPSFVLADDKHVFNLVPDRVMLSPDMLTYRATSGMHLLFDFISGLPNKGAHKIQIAYCFYAGSQAVGPVQALPVVTPERDALSPTSGQETQRCLIGQQRVIDGDAAEDINLVLEVQRLTDGDVRSVGWCIIPLFSPMQSIPGETNRYSCLAPAVRAPLLKPPVNTSSDIAANLRAITSNVGFVHLRILTHSQFMALLEAAQMASSSYDIPLITVAAAPSFLDLSNATLSRLLTPRYELSGNYRNLLEVLPSKVPTQHSISLDAKVEPISLDTKLDSSRNAADYTAPLTRQQHSISTTLETTTSQDLAWCDVGVGTPPQVAFDAGVDGFDVYVDAARFLPDNVTVSKAVAKVMNRSFAPVGAPLEAIATLESDILSPVFGLHGRFLPSSSDAFSAEGGMNVVRYLSPVDVSATLVVRIDTVESHTHNVQVAGYAVLNVFALLGGTSADLPTDMSRAVLNSGAFQLPLFQVPPIKTAPLTAVCLDASPRVPCATVLVRIVHLPKIVNAPDARTAVPRYSAPAYGTQVYDSSRCKPMPAEVLLYPKRADISAPRVRELLDHYSEQGANCGLSPAVGPIDPASVSPTVPVPADTFSFGVPPPRTAGERESEEWIRKRLTATPSAMLDFMYLAPYDAAMGFKVRVDAVHNLPSDTKVFAKVLHCVYPPGGLYATPTDSSTGYFTQSHDWDKSVQTFQRYKDGYAVHVGVPFTPGMCVILDVRGVSFKKGNLVIEQLGWGILPIMDARAEGYVARGAFVIPLLQGSPSKIALDALMVPGVPVYETIRRITGLSQPVVAAPVETASGGIFGRPASKQPVIKPVCSFLKEATSVLVRLHDGQLTGMMGIGTASYSTVHVPEELRAKYEVPETIMADTIAAAASQLARNWPKKASVDEMDLQLNTVISNSTGVPIRTKASTVTGVLQSPMNTNA